MAPPSPTRIWLFAGLAVAAVGVYDDLLIRLRAFAHRRADAPPWWFGYARDAVNLGSGGLLWATFAAAGFPGQQALLLGLATAFTVYVLDAVAGMGRAAGRPRRDAYERAIVLSSVTLLCALGFAHLPTLRGALSSLLTAVEPRR